MSTLPDVSVIIVSYNTETLLAECIDRLKESTKDLHTETVIVDNKSRDNSIEFIRSHYQNIHLITNEVNMGFGRANNIALPFTHGRYVLLLNTDAFVAPDTVTKTVAYMDSNLDCGILGVKLSGRDGSLQPSARYFPTAWNLFLTRTGLNRFFHNTRTVDDMSWGHDEVRRCDWVPGCYYLVRKEVIDEIGLFDPRFFLYYEEVDHCFSAKKAGWNVVFYPHTTVIHIGGESAKADGEITASGRQISDIQIESELLYFRKNHGLTGLFLNVALTSLSILINALKKLIKLRFPIEWKTSLNQLLLMYSIVLRTRLGSRPTR